MKIGKWNDGLMCWRGKDIEGGIEPVLEEDTRLNQVILTLNMLSN